MADLWALIPSRDRPENVETICRTFALTCRAHTRIHFAFDDDDPRLAESITAAAGHKYTTGPRDTLAGWTNKLAADHPRAPYLASIGDDMVPVTDGWDERLIAVLEKNGPGFAYPNDRRREDIPEAVVISAAIVRELGGMVPVGPDGRPVVSHWYCDNMWADLGNLTNSLHYLPKVIVRHDHPNVTGRPGDATYAHAATRFNADLAAYQRWRLAKSGMGRDVAAVRRAQASA
jgi:hypothetical protein